MQAYYIEYSIRGKQETHAKHIDAKSVSSAKKKIGKKHGYKDGRMIQVNKVSVIGYF